MSKLPTYSAVPSTWAAPPTPQDSQTSLSMPPSPTPAMALPSTPMRAADPITPPVSSDRAATVAEARRLYAATSTPSSQGVGEVRMEQWLAGIPPPVTPHERYLQGLNPVADHPLHPRPLQVSAARLSRVDAVPPADFDGEDKENCVGPDKLTELTAPGGDSGVNAGLHDQSMPGTKKRHMPEHNMSTARKRTRILDPMRRFSQRISTSLSLYPNAEDEFSARYSEDLSPEDREKQNEKLYKFNQVSQQTGARKSSFRVPLTKRAGSTVRSQGSVRRMMFQKAPLSTVPRPHARMGVWTEGRPDMIVNVAFIGDACVGKSALLRRLVYGTFPHSYAPSDIQENTVRLTVNDARVELNLSEGGSGRDPSQPSLLALGWFSVVVLCFDIGHKSSLHNLTKYRNNVAMYEENSVIVLAGLKKDARHRLPPLQLSYVEEPNQVSTDEGREAARALNCASYFECSSLSSCDGVDDLFDYIVRAGVDLHKARDKKMARLRFERSVDKGVTKIADGVRSLFLFPGTSHAA